MEQAKDYVLRQSLLEIMDEIHRVCTEHGFTYYIIFGTLIGAVRHKGFIPWDTDIDIGMPRADYDRFMKESNLYFKDGFSCHYHGNTKDWYNPHALVYNENTIITWNKDHYRNKKDNPVYVDVFPLDKGEESWTKRAARTKEIDAMLYELSRRECLLYKRNSFIQMALKSLYAKTKKLLLSDAKFVEKLDKKISQCQDEESYVLGTYGQYYILNRVFGEPTLYEFEGRQYYGPQDADTYLTLIYGNYHKLPPVEAQVQHLDLIGSITQKKEFE